MPKQICFIAIPLNDADYCVTSLDAAQAMVEAVAHKFGIIEVPSKVYLSENEKGEFDFAFVFIQEDLKPAN